jgi:hypothetical protein
LTLDLDAQSDTGFAEQALLDFSIISTFFALRITTNPQVSLW